MLRCIFRLFLCLAIVSLLAVPALAQEQPAAGVSFSKDIAPLLLKNCQACHGASDAKGGFQLGSYTALMKPGDSGSASITPGKPDDSEVLRLISVQDKGERMPKDGDPLPADKIALVRKWIEEGAKYDSTDPNAALASIVEDTSLEADLEGITGFMQSAARSILEHVWIHGDALKAQRARAGR